MRKMIKTEIVATVGVLMMTSLLLALYFYADNRLLTMEQAENGGARLDRHYAFISEDESDLWTSVFDAAESHAEEMKAYLEWIGKDSPVTYSIGDCMRIATASGVDGIILHKSAGDDLRVLVDAADEEGIPVVTLFEDESESRRISYVGMNNYQAGENYAGQIIRCLEEGENHILVISGSPLAVGGASLLYSQMVQATEQGRQPGQTVTFEALEVNSATSFDAEEAIRDVFVNNEDTPDIMVCLDLTTTECVSQALVDYNEVGNVTVIGFYASDTVSEAIDRGIINSTLAVDAAQIGEVSVDALDEYWSQGRVSNYFNVSLSVVGEA